MTSRLTWLQYERRRNRIAVAADMTMTAWCHRTVTCRRRPHPMVPVPEQVTR